MTNEEFDVLDELYFVQSFDQLKQETAKEPKQLIQILKSLYAKGWIKVMNGVDNELTPDQVNFGENAENYHYLASKEGLLAHNS